MRRFRWWAAGLLTTLLTLSCSSELLQPGGGGDGPSDPGVEALAIRLTVDLEAGVVRQAPGQPARSTTGGQPSFAILGTNEVAVIATNLVRSAPSNGQVTVTFDAAVTNRLTSASLVPSTFPSTTGGTGLLLFPFRVTQVVGGTAAQVVASTAWDGDGSAGSGAPRNFFNDFGCKGGSNDCYRWEQFPAPLGPGETTAARQVGFTLPRQVTSFTVLLVLAADISSDLPGVARLIVTPSSYTFGDGFPANFSATAYDINGQPLPWATITWQTEDLLKAPFQYGGALVDRITGPSVIVHARQVGPTSFTASSGGVSVTVPLDIQVNTVALVQVYVAPDSVLDVGETVQGDARVKDHSGQIIPIPPTWDTSDPSVAVVTLSGQIIAVGPGTVTITATAGAVTGSVPLTVNPPLASGSISGAVVTGSPWGTNLPNVDVLVQQDILGPIVAQTTTNETGDFLLPQVPAGPLLVTLANLPLGCSARAVLVTVPPGGSVWQLLHGGCTGGLSVRLLDGGVIPLPGVRVIMDGYYRTTDANGQIDLSGYPGFPITLHTPEVGPGCLEPNAISPAPLPFGVNVVEWWVDCPGTATLLGRVTTPEFVQFDGSAVPVPGATVQASRLHQDSLVPPVLTGSDGSYLMDPAPIGDVAVDVTGGPCLRGFAYITGILGRSTVTQDVAMTGCAAHQVSVAVQLTSSTPVGSIDILVRSLLTGSVFGVTVPNDGASHTLPVLADDGSILVSLALPANCPAVLPRNSVASPTAPTVMTFTVQCQ